MTESKFYIVTTRRFVLKCRHEEWLEETQKIYSQVLLYYYNLFLDLEADGRNLAAQGTQQVLRELEMLTIVGRDKQSVPYPLPYEKVPLYFRRAAINAGIAAGRSYLGRKVGRIQKAEMQKAQMQKAEQTEGLHQAGKQSIWQEKRAETFRGTVTFYKGNYCELTEDGVTLKIWNGEKWTWMHCRLSGNHLPDQGQCLSPCLTLDGRSAFLNVPVKEAVSDGRKAKERVAQGSKVCSVQFTNTNAIAVGVVLDRSGTQTGVKFFNGGDKYVHHCRHAIEKIDASERAMGRKNVDVPGKILKETASDTKELFQYDKKYWMKLKELKNHYAHDISRHIVDYCVEEGVGILILPEYDVSYTKYVMCSAGNWSALHLSIRIREQLFYKAWHSGITVLETGAYGCSTVCSVCGGPIQKKKDEYICQNGHRGNRYINSARNLGVKCLKSFQRTNKVP